ncbi:MAG: hypothetical protein NVS3B25_07220 [Hymenobacter sp.]
MPCDYSLYPADWKERRNRILARAGQILDNKGSVFRQANCETCGVPNHEIVYRRKDDRLKWRGPNTIDLGEEDPDYRATLVVLTVAHLDRTGPPGPNDGPLDCPDDRLAALCQSCHLHLDRYRHQAKAAETRRKKAGTADLFSAIQ